MAHLASGDIDIERSVLPNGEAGVDETCRRMVELASGEYGSKSPRIRALAINAINAAGVGDKDYYGYAKAIHEWVRDQIRYVKDPIGQETLSHPEELAFNSRAGDCLDENTRLLTPTGYVRIADVKPGDTIQGKLGWTTVTKVWDKGLLPARTYALNNLGYFTATDDHICFRIDGSEARAAELELGDRLLSARPLDQWPDINTEDEYAVIKVSEPSVRHVYDIETEDHGIYLVDAGVVVHNCDDKTILEMAMLGAVGIRSYPVVVGVRPGSFSHVYLNIVIPEGGRPGRYAGRHIPADPIMREWPLGQEVPAGKISQRKTYEHLSGLGAMPLNGYMTGPSYLDETEARQVPRVMSARLVDTASRGEILNAPKVNEHNTDERDDLFREVPELALQSAPWAELGPLGPITGAEAANAYRPVPTRTYETAMPGPRSFQPRTAPVAQRAPGLAPDGVMVDHNADLDVNADVSDMAGLGAYIDSLMGATLAGLGAEAVVPAAWLANREAKAARRSRKPAVRAAAARVEQKAKALYVAATTEAKQLAVARRQVAGLQRLAQRGVVQSLRRRGGAFSDRVKNIQRALYSPLALPAQREVGDRGTVTNLNHPLMTPLPRGSVVRDRSGRAVGLAGFFSKAVKSVSKKISKATKPVTKPLSSAFKALPTPAQKVLSLGVGVPAALALSPMTLLPGGSAPVYQLNRAAVGDKWGGRLTNVERLGAAATAMAVTAGAAGAPIVAGGGATYGLTAGGAAIVQGATTGLLVGGGLAAVNLADATSTKRLASGQPARIPTQNVGLIPYSSDTGLLAQGSSPIPVYDGSGGGSYSDFTADLNDPYADMSSAAGATQPVDSFGPSDQVGPAFESDSATSEPATSTTEVDASDPTLVDEDASEGSVDIPSAQPARRLRRARRTRPAAVQADETQDLEPALDEALPVVADEDLEEDLDAQRVDASEDVAGIDGSAVSLTTLALLGLGAYLLLKK